MKDFDFEMDLDSILAEFSGDSYNSLPGNNAANTRNNDTERALQAENTESENYSADGYRNAPDDCENVPVHEPAYEPEHTGEDYAPVVPGRAARRSVNDDFDDFYADDSSDESAVLRRGAEKRARSVPGRTGTGSERSERRTDGRSDENGKAERAARVKKNAGERTENREGNRRRERTEESEYRENRYKESKYKDRERKPGRTDSEDTAKAAKRESRERAARELSQKGTETAKKAVSGIKNFVLTFTGLVFGAGALIVLAWMLINVHPDSSMASTQLTSKNRANIVTQLDSYANNAKGELLSDLTYIRKHYLIPEGDLVAPEAPTYNYGTTTDPQEVLAVIEEARSYGLLEGQNVIFNENVDFYYDSDIQYYCDESLLVICWKELIDNRICSCVEVKMADGSQLRRKLAEDTYGSSTYVYATELAAQCNAVVAMNADYYAFRDLGVTVYNRKLYRFDDANYNGQYSKYNATDSLLIDSSGDFHIFHKGETSTREAMEQYVADNNIMFSVAFGPVLVEDWGQVWCDWYPVGETDKEYSRAGIAQYDSMHYLYMTVSFADNENEYHPRCTVNEFAAIMAGKGVKTAYCLDGGQTGEVVFRGEPYNHIDFGTERTVSDIIYFATAIPESER